MLLQLREARGLNRCSRGGELRAFAIRGNHEHKHLPGAKGEVVLSFSQEIARKQAGDSYPAFLCFFESLPYFLELEGATVVHGELEPDPAIWLVSQLPEILCGTRRGEHLLAEKFRVPWFEAYKGEIPVIFGHVYFHKNGEPLIYKDRVFGLDTGCVFGGRLTGVLLPSYTLVSVPRRGNHCRDLRREYLPQRPARPPRPPRPPSQPVLEWDAGAEFALTALPRGLLRKTFVCWHNCTHGQATMRSLQGKRGCVRISDCRLTRTQFPAFARHGKLARD